MKQKLQNIPTNIITGFLGVGKTTAILHLLKQKPENERWAILVNEFGEIGIDGSILDGNSTEDANIFIREVAGGCMCCAAGLPLQIALTLLLNEARPDRLLIEPTGLGHPKEVLEVLSEGHYDTVLDLQQTVTLVDARKILDDRYRKHPTFIQQLEVADVIVANKIDQYEENYIDALQDFLTEIMPNTHKQLHQVSMGKIDLQWLEGKTSKLVNHAHKHLSKPKESLPMPGDESFPDCGYLKVDNKGEGFYSQGWVFQSTFVFDNHKLNALFLGIHVERLKGVFITSEGFVNYNKADGVLTEISLEKTDTSRVEFISDDEAYLSEFEQELMACLSD